MLYVDAVALSDLVTITPYSGLYDGDYHSAIEVVGYNGFDDFQVSFMNPDGIYESNWLYVRDVNHSGTINYLITSTDPNLTSSEVETSAIINIEKKTATVTVDNYSKCVDEEDPTFGYVANGILEVDELQGIIISRDEGESPGIYSISATQDVEANPNYQIEFYNGKLTITNHSWSEPQYSWLSDNASVSATHICKNCNKIEAETVETILTESDPTCTEAGKKEYITKPFTNSAFIQQSKTIITAEHLDHDWNAPLYIWATDYSSVTASRFCNNDVNHVEEETKATTSRITTPATCIQMGETTYTSECFDNGAFAVQSKTVKDVSATGHSWFEPSYSWNDNYSEVTATKVCRNDSTHVEIETVAAEEIETVPSTCFTEGSVLYRSVKFDDETFEVQEISIPLPLTKHVISPHIENETVTYWECSTCGKMFSNSEGTDENEIIDSGSCGVNVTWTLDRSGLLSVMGNGRMNEYYNNYDNSKPWKSKQESIYSIIIQEGVTHIGYNAFNGCKNVTTVYIPQSVASISNSAFSYCSSLQEITLPENVTSISDYAFSYCSSLQEITLPEQITRINDSTFKGCSSLATVTIQGEITSIGQYAFNNCYKLADLLLPNSLQTIGMSAFENCGLVSIVLPNSITELGNSAFSGCGGLRTITLPDHLTKIGGFLFNECTNLKHITLPEELTEIGFCMFQGCKKLESIDIPSSITYIGGNAFFGCSSLETITIPVDVTYIGSNAFKYCKCIPNNVFFQCSEYTLQWARDNSITYNRVHVIKDIEAIEPTCIDSGITKGSYCTGCNEILLEPITIPAKGHTKIIDIPATEPTCTNEGATELSHCSACGEIISEQSPIPARHTLVIDPYVAPTMESTGLTEGYHCSKCHQIIVAREVIPKSQALSVSLLSCYQTSLLIGTVPFQQDSAWTNDEWWYRIPDGLYNRLVISRDYGTHSRETMLDAIYDYTIISSNYQFPKCSAVYGVVGYKAVDSKTHEYIMMFNLDSYFFMVLSRSYDRQRAYNLVISVANNALQHPFVIDPAISPTCSTGGLSQGSHCAKCGRIISSQTSIPAIGHDWGTPMYVWTENNTEVTATRICGNDASHIETETVPVSPEVSKTATCTENGETTYTTTDFKNEAFSAQVKTLDDIPALGHAWSETIYTWNLNNTKVTATRTCENDTGHTETEEKGTTSEITTQPTCIEMGKTTYTSDTFSNTAFTVQTKTLANIDIVPSNHDWNVSVYDWTSDNSKATATRVCAHDASHIEMEEVTTTSEVTKPATCDVKGETTYTAAFTKTAFTVQTKTVDDIPATGHTLIAHERKEPTCEENGIEAYWKCSACRRVFRDKDGNTEIGEPLLIDSLGHVLVEDLPVIPTCTESGLTQGFHCYRCKEVLIAQDVIPPYGHIWEVEMDLDDCAPDLSWLTYVVSCARDETHTRRVKVDTQVNIKKRPTETEEGQVEYCPKAPFVIDGAELIYPTLRLTIPALNISIMQLPESLSAIEEEAFANLNMQAVIVPNGCTSIGKYAFKDCSKLKYIQLSESTVIDPDALHGCKNVIVDRIDSQQIED